MAELIIIRGNSGSGKTTLARNLLRKFGRNTMVISQDVIRRDMLMERDGFDTKALPLLIELLKYGRRNCEVTILEGILNSQWYKPLFETAILEYGSNIHAYYYDIPFEETVQRHKTKSNCNEFGEDSMRIWWKEKDYIKIIDEIKFTSDVGVEKAIEIIESNNMDKDKVLVVYLEDVHESIAGIIAGRIRERYNLPTIILTKAHEVAKGSGRSIEEYNMFEELLKCKELLGKFGGHPMAAGLSLQEDKVDELRIALNNKCELTDEDLTRKIMIDSSLPLEYLNLHLIEELNVLEPFGKGNSKPVFGVRDAKITKAILLGKDKNVLKLKLLTNNNITIDAMIFND